MPDISWKQGHPVRRASSPPALDAQLPTWSPPWLGREFWAANYSKIKEANAKLPILLRETANAQAQLTATYGADCGRTERARLPVPGPLRDASTPFGDACARAQSLALRSPLWWRARVRRSLARFWSRR